MHALTATVRRIRIPAHPDPLIRTTRNYFRNKWQQESRCLNPPRFENQKRPAVRITKLSCQTGLKLWKKQSLRTIECEFTVPSVGNDFFVGARFCSVSRRSIVFSRL
jgi:hypothetical protein